MRVPNERGAIGGVEGLAFGVLVFVMGTLVVSNAWLVVDAKLATSAAAREAARAYVESDSARSARSEALDAAQSTLDGHGLQALDVALDASSFDRCQPVRVEVSVSVPMVAVPLIGASGGTRQVASSHSEVVDPYRSGLTGMAACST